MTETTYPVTSSTIGDTLDELIGESGETIALWRIDEGRHGPVAVYEELSHETSKLLQFGHWEHNPRGRAFMAHREAARRAQLYVSHPKFGAYIHGLDFSYEDRPEPGILRRATLPTAEAMNGGLDKISRQDGSLRFYEPISAFRVTPLEEFVPHLAQGLAPLPPPARNPDTSNFFHDLTDHAVGYSFIDSKRTEMIQKRAGEIKLPISRDDNRGDPDPQDPAVAFAVCVDNLSNLLNRNIIFEWERNTKGFVDIARHCGAIASRNEVALLTEVGLFATDFAPRLVWHGLSAAFALTHHKRLKM